MSVKEVVDKFKTKNKVYNSLTREEQEDCIKALLDLGYHSIRTEMMAAKEEVPILGLGKFKLHKSKKQIVTLLMSGVQVNEAVSIVRDNMQAEYKAKIDKYKRNKLKKK